MTLVPSSRALNVFFAVVLAYIAGFNHDTIKTQLAEAGCVCRDCACALADSTKSAKTCTSCPAPSVVPCCGCPSGKTCTCTVCRCE